MDRIDVLSQLSNKVGTCYKGKFILETMTNETEAELKFKKKKGMWKYYLYLPVVNARFEMGFDEKEGYFYLPDKSEHIIWAIVCQLGKEKCNELN